MKNTFGGYIRGDTLLLTRDGGLCSARSEMFFPPSGNHEEGNLDSTFEKLSREGLDTYPWAGLNSGRWRKQPDLKVYGLAVQTMKGEFKSSYRPGSFSRDDPGKGTSIALSKLLRTGKTQWPRHFDEYYGS